MKLYQKARSGILKVEIVGKKNSRKLLEIENRWNSYATQGMKSKDVLSLFTLSPKKVGRLVFLDIEAREKITGRRLNASNTQSVVINFRLFLKKYPTVIKGGVASYIF